MSDETTLSREQIEEMIGLKITSDFLPTFAQNLNNMIDKIVEQNESASRATSEEIQRTYDFVVKFTNDQTAINERIIESLQANAQDNNKLESLSKSADYLLEEVAKLHRQILTQQETNSKIFGIIAQQELDRGVVVENITQLKSQIEELKRTIPEAVENALEAFNKASAGL